MILVHDDDGNIHRKQFSYFPAPENKASVVTAAWHERYLAGQCRAGDGDLARYQSGPGNRAVKEPSRSFHSALRMPLLGPYIC